MMRLSLIIFLFLGSMNTGWSQNIDSLVGMADTLSDNNRKSLILWDLAQHYDSTGQHAEAIETAKESLRIAKSTNNQSLMTQAYLKLAKIYYLLGNTDESMAYLKLYSLMDKALQDEAYQREIIDLINQYNREKQQLQEDIYDLESLASENLKELSRLRNIADYQKTFLIAALVVFVVFIGVSSYLQFNTGRKYKQIVRKHSAYTQHLESELEEITNELTRVNDKLKAIESERRRQLSFAQRVKRQLFGDPKKFRKAFPKSMIFEQPRDVSAGDFLWYGSTRKKHIVIVCDTSSAALTGTYVSLIINEFLRHLVYEQNITSPNILLTLLDQQLKQKLDLEDKSGFYGFKASAAIFSKDKTELDISSAVLPVYLFQKHKLKQIQPTRQPLGSSLMKEKFYEVNKFELNKNDTLYMLTDGFEDQFGGNDHKKFKRTALRELLTSIETQKMKDQEFVVQKVFKDWKGLNPQTDDVLIVGIAV